MQFRFSNICNIYLTKLKNVILSSKNYIIILIIKFTYGGKYIMVGGKVYFKNFSGKMGELF